jgi:hypothetical protein
MRRSRSGFGTRPAAVLGASSVAASARDTKSRGSGRPPPPRPPCGAEAPGELTPDPHRGGAGEQLRSPPGEGPASSATRRTQAIERGGTPHRSWRRSSVASSRMSRPSARIGCRSRGPVLDRDEVDRPSRSCSCERHVWSSTGLLRRCCRASAGARAGGRRAGADARRSRTVPAGLAETRARGPGRGPLGQLRSSPRSERRISHGRSFPRLEPAAAGRNPACRGPRTGAASASGPAISRRP